MIYVQFVELLYTKTSRGAPMATLRNSVPRAFPTLPPTDVAYAFERIRLLEWEGFEAKREALETRDVVPRRQTHLVLEPTQGGLLLGLEWTSWLGQPKRSPRPGVLRIESGETAQLMINGRYTSYSGQHYTEATYNVATGARLDVGMFIDSQASKTFDLRADLF